MNGLTQVAPRFTDSSVLANDAIIKTLHEIISDISDSMCQNIRSNDDYTPESDLKKIEALVLAGTILERMDRYR